MKLLLIIFALALATPSGAFDLGATSPAKPNTTHTPPPPDPDLLRQGGDTIADAVEIALPVWNLEGTTTGYTDDHDEACPYTGSTSPDVVYRFTVDADFVVDIDMFGSTYDTKIYVYDEDLVLLACNDDFYSDYVSRIEYLPLQAGVIYYLVIDGYGGDSGDYVLNIHDTGPPCVVLADPGMAEENEPPLMDGYQDAYNGGCNSPEFGSPFGSINPYADMFGTSGWYLNYDGTETRDTDWYEHQLGPDGYRVITGDAEFETYIFELGPQDCGQVGVLQDVVIGPCQEASLTITGAPYSTVWIWVGPTTFSGPVTEYHYKLDLHPTDGLATEVRSWSGVKGLFR